jgi:multiple antibiotic resistance protein
MPLDFLKTAFVTLLVTLDPPGLAPVFIGLTLGMSGAAKREVALRASLIAFVILAAFALGGRTVLEALGITIPAFRVAGGLLLFYVAFDMLFALRGERKREIASDAVTIDHIRNVAAFPLAIPLIAGPGAITATMLLAAQAHGEILKFGSLFLIIGFVTLCCYIAFRLANVINKLLGITGNVVLTRLLGIVLSALAVQFIVDGVRAAIGG